MRRANAARPPDDLCHPADEAPGLRLFDDQVRHRRPLGEPIGRFWPHNGDVMAGLASHTRRIFFGRSADKRADRLADKTLVEAPRLLVLGSAHRL